jgi:hypothetical protein
MLPPEPCGQPVSRDNGVAQQQPLAPGSAEDTGGMDGIRSVEER